MVYVEMARDEKHGGGSWGFTQCIWAPVRKPNNSKWPFWSMVGQVLKGDTILHLRGVHPKASFVGYSTVSSDGYIPADRPPEPGHWAFSERFFRADLEDFTPFSEPMNLVAIFEERREILEEYLQKNKSRGGDALKLFYVLQAGRLQCYNGGYLSQIDDELFHALFDKLFSANQSPVNFPIASEVQTASQLTQVLRRIGQSEFSKNVRKNFGNQCCFPGCTISDLRLLIGSHIARWADNEKLRGRTDNGLCFCPIHDKAFELGFFTLDSSFAIRLNPEEATAIKSITTLESAEGLRIKPSKLIPDLHSLSTHWSRIGFKP